MRRRFLEGDVTTVVMRVVVVVVVAVGLAGSLDSLRIFWGRIGILEGLVEFEEISSVVGGGGFVVVVCGDGD